MPTADSSIHIRLDGKNNEATLKEIQRIWNRLYPDIYFTWYDIEKMFLSRNHKVFEFSGILRMYAMISLFLTCFGLFGMAFYAVRQQTKEVGIRKVNGATTGQVLFQLNRQFIYGTGIALIIAWPVSYYLLNRWLENYIYRVKVDWVSGLIAFSLVLTVTLLTVCWHSYKAATANPADVLKNE